MLYYAKAIQMLRNLITLPRGLLLYGPHGTGKTSLVRAIVDEYGANLTIISPNAVDGPHAGQSERTLREAFSEASSHTASGKPSHIFIHKIDALCPLQDFKRGKDVRIAALLGILMDSSKATSSTPGVVVVASTNRVDAIDPALRRYGRFDIETEVTVPNEMERLQILELYTRKIPRNSCDLESVAASCKGYVGADLEVLCREAVSSAVQRSLDAMKDVNDSRLTMEDWSRAMSCVHPSIATGITLEIPEVTFNDIGGLNDVKTKLKEACEWLTKHPAAFSRSGTTTIRGILLHGPLGCGKTTLAKAVANAVDVPFISLSGAGILSKFAVEGEGEGYLREIFHAANLAGKSIIFFNEVDFIAGNRGDSSSGNSAAKKILSALLTEMDGLAEAKGVLVLAATNRIDAIDDALKCPGRFDLILDVPPPDLEGRCEILDVLTRKMKVGSDVDLRRLAEDTELFTGADLWGLCNEAGMEALRESMDAGVADDRHFQAAKNSLKATLTKFRS